MTMAVWLGWVSLFDSTQPEHVLFSVMIVTQKTTVTVNIKVFILYVVPFQITKAQLKAKNQELEARLNALDVLVAQNAQLIADNAQLIAEKGNLITTNAQLIAQIQIPGNCCIAGPPGPQGPPGIQGPPGLMDCK